MMIKDICIATVAYPQAQPYFLDFVEGLKNTQNVNQLTLVVAEQGVTNIVDHLNGIDYKILRIGQDLSIPAVRANLFRYLKNNTNAKYYIFIDIDDRLRSDGLNFHIETLQKADFSYGDQNLYSALDIAIRNLNPEKVNARFEAVHRFFTHRNDPADTKDQTYTPGNS